MSSISKPGFEQHSALDLPHDFKEADRQVEPIVVDGVAESILKGIDSELLERFQSRSADVKTSEPLVETKQDSPKRQEQPRQRQKNGLRSAIRGLKYEDE